MAIADLEEMTTALESLSWDVSWADLDPATKHDIEHLCTLTSPMLNLPYIATMKQMLGHLAWRVNTMKRPLLYGGGMRGGKSTWLCGEAIREARDLKETRILLGRFTLTAFRDTTLVTLSSLADYHHEFDWNKSDHTFQHRQTGSIIQYAQLGSEDDIQRIGSSEFSFVGIDEATEVSLPVFSMLQTRLAHPAGFKANPCRLKLRLSCNPNPGWIKERFVTKPYPGYKMLKALAADNPNLYPGYIDEMRESMVPERFAAWIEGDWDAFIPEMAALPAHLISAAQTPDRWRVETFDPTDMVWGVDPGHLGSDHTAIWERGGMVFRRVDKWLRLRTDETADQIIGLYNARTWKPRMMNIDIDGIGAGVWDNLIRAQQDGRLPKPPELAVIGVHAQGKPSREQPIGNPMRYTNVKSECFFALRMLLEGKRGAIEDDPDVLADLSTPYYDTPGGRIQIESKESVRSRLGRSPNDGDALLLTMYLGRQDEIGHNAAQRQRLQAAEHDNPITRQRLQAERERLHIENRTATAIENLTGRAVRPRKRNRLGY